MTITLAERLAWAAIALVCAVLGIAWERHEGAQSCVERDTAAGTHQEVVTAAAEATGSAEVAKEIEDYARATNQPITTAPHISVCVAAQPSAARAVLPARASRASAHAAADVPAAGASVARVLDGERLEEIARQADAQIAGLQDYVLRVCPPP